MQTRLAVSSLIVPPARLWLGRLGDAVLSTDHKQRRCLAVLLLADAITPAQRALLTDPQTSGGLLVSCDPASVDEVLALFAREGFADAAVIGRMEAGAARVAVR